MPYQYTMALEAPSDIQFTLFDLLKVFSLQFSKESAGVANVISLLVFVAALGTLLYALKVYLYQPGLVQSFGKRVPNDIWFELVLLNKYMLLQPIALLYCYGVAFLCLGNTQATFFWSVFAVLPLTVMLLNNAEIVDTEEPALPNLTDATLSTAPVSQL